MTAPLWSAHAHLVGAAGLGDLTAAPPTGPTTAGVGAAGEPTPAPGQAPSGGLESWEVSPGLLGFVPVFLIALACVGLFLSLTRHMRRVTVRQALRDAEDEAAARDAGPAAGATGAGEAGGPESAPGRPGAGEGPSGGR